MKNTFSNNFRFFRSFWSFWSCRRFRRFRLPALLLLALLALVPAGCSGKTPADSGSRADTNPAGAVFSSKYAFTTQNLAGKNVSLEDYAGKVVFLNFWASWCSPCMAEMPEFKAFSDTIASSGMNAAMLLVNSGESKSTAQSTGNSKGVSSLILLDTDNRISAQYNITAIPTTFVFKPDGTLYTTIKGSTNAKTLQQAYDYASK